jgi:iron complex outermembrane recepter protein
VKQWCGVVAAMTICGLAALPGAAHAQHADEDAVASADDAFGINVANESIGIYSERDARGFSPLDAGNARIDGIYYDPAGALSSRLRESTTIRIGMAAEGFPFHAPTGIVDYKFKQMPAEYGHSLSYQFSAFGGFIRDWDIRVPFLDGKAGLTGGLAWADLRQSSGFRNVGWGWTVRPILRVARTEIAPFASRSHFYKVRPPAIAVLGGAALPDFPGQKRLKVSQSWMEGANRNDQYGVTVKSRLTSRLSLRAGIFHASVPKQENFSDIYRIPAQGGAARHFVIADPYQDIHTTSGEAVFVLRLGGERVRHRILAGYRARNRLTERGGSQVIRLPDIVYGDFEPAPRPDFEFTTPSAGRLRQSSWMLGYIGAIEGVGTLNLGVQKGRYRATSRDGLTGAIDRSRADPWLYNAVLSADITPSLSFYIGTERGLEDRGVAPESAANRSEQLPATLATQYEGGVRWKFPQGQLVVNLFEISKPYFSFNAANRFVELGKERHRGVEVSMSGNFRDRLKLVAGLVAMKPDVTGPAVARGEVGERAAGTPTINARVDLNYRTDLLGGLTPTATVKYTGKRAVSARPLAALGGRQLTLPGYATVDLGLRHKFKVGSVPANLRAVVDNVFDAKAWDVPAADAVYPANRRRFTLYIAADF